MIAILYGSACAPFVEPIARDIQRAAAEAGATVHALTAEQAARHPARCARIERLYVLPFDVPGGESLRPATFVSRLFPRATVVNPMDAHELCWDKFTTAERLLARGIPVPESLYTASADEVREFVARHGFAILKERRSCGGQGHVVLCDTDDVLVGEVRGRRFAVELEGAEARRTLRHGVLTYPAPFYVQRLIGDTVRGRFRPGRVLRAYVIHGRVAFWTERYRERYLRPADWVVSVGLGAKYRFVLEVSEEIRKVAVRTSDVLGMAVGAVDLIHTGGSGPYVLEADTDGHHMYIDRQFKQIPDYRDPFDFDRLIAAALVGEPANSTGGARDAV